MTPGLGRGAFAGLLAASVIGCTMELPRDQMPVSPDAGSILSQLLDWSGPIEREDSLLRDDLDGVIDGRIQPMAQVICASPDGEGSIFICHFFWSVAVCHVSRDAVLDEAHAVRGKCGFTLSRTEAVEVTAHEHPGTGLFTDCVYRLARRGGRMHLDPVSAAARSPAGP